MSDLVERLKTTRLLSQRNQHALQTEAAERIEHLEAALRDLLSEMGDIGADGYLYEHSLHEDTINAARAALRNQP